MRRRARVGLGVAALFAAALLGRNALAQMFVTFHAPHAVRAPAAVVDSALTKTVDAQAGAAKIATPDDLIAFVLHVTASALHFGLEHHTRLSFDAKEREGNCVEYAELFASFFNREHGDVDARAWVVRSDATILGQAIPNPAWKDHDWVLVVAHTPAGTRRFFVDPTLYDMGLGWDISRAVRGDVRVP